MTRRDDQLGGKVGPRLAQLLLQHQVAARRALGPLEARWRAAAGQQLIDRAGHEIAGLYAPLLQHALADADRDLHPVMRRHLERITSGTNQWESILGHVGMQAAGSIGAVFSNVLYPVAAAINLADRSTPVDAQTGALAVAAGLAGYADGDRNAGTYGYTSDAWRLLAELAYTIPDPGIIGQLVNRGELSEEQALYWLHRGQLPAELRGPALALRRQLLSPADAALGLLRGMITQGRAREIAHLSGMTDADLQVLVDNTGEPPGIMQLLEAYRRKFIDRDRLERGVRESRVRDEWLDVIEALRYAPVPTADAVDAWLRGHLDRAEAVTIAEQNGVLPGQTGILLDNAGNPPGDVQLIELWRRKFITEAELERGLRFGRLRDEFIPWIKHLRFDRLPTADAVDAWLRGHLTRPAAETIMEENGLDPRDFAAAFGNAGNPLALMQLLEAYRRKLIDRDRFITGFRESRYRDEWAGTALELAYSPMSTADAIEASVQAHLTKERALAIAIENGLREADFEPLWQTAGEPLSRTEIEQLYNRRLVTRATVDQALRESRLKDKYVADAFELHVRLPEPRQIVTAIELGSITREAGLQLLAEHGYTEQVAAMLVANGEARSTGPHRQLMTAEISKLYADRIIGEAKAVQLLEALHYTAASAGLILQLADYTARRRILDSAITGIRAHYLSGRIDATVASADLHALGLPAATAQTYMTAWRLEKLAHPRQLTEAQIVKAAKLGLFTPAGQEGTPDGAVHNEATARARLVALGYDDTDAGLLLAGA